MKDTMSTESTEPRWYCLSRDGLATLCIDEEDAKEVAAESLVLYPQNGPYRAVQMVEVSAVARAVAEERERWRAHIAVTLRGIDREETEDRTGWCWWETSQGAAFGADVLRRALAGPPTAQAPASPADAAPAP